MMVHSFCLRFVVVLLLLQFIGHVTAVAKDYGKYGILTNDAPFNTKIIPRPLPVWPAKEIGIKFFLFSEKASEKAIHDEMSADQLMESGYDGTKKTFLIIHGWKEDPMKLEKCKWAQPMKNALLEKEKDANVIIVSWANGANAHLPQAIGNTRLVGAMVAELIKLLNKAGNTPDKVHVIGFSLGAQVAGYVGKRFQDPGSKIGRITGLDPASPGFKGEADEVKLIKTDAQFVDVIHTDSANLGTSDKSGKFDFWPNDGISQPGCPKEDIFCAHLRAPAYFIDSIKFRGCFLSSTTLNEPEMGYNAIKYKDEKDDGNFFPNTKSESPYCTERPIVPKLKKHFVIGRPNKEHVQPRVYMRKASVPPALA